MENYRCKVCKQYFKFVDVYLTHSGTVCCNCVSEDDLNNLKVGRTFSTGATRDTDENKLDYARALSPHVIERFLEYMSKHRETTDGMRDWDNWKKGIPLGVYCSSLHRHYHDVWKTMERNAYIGIINGKLPGYCTDEFEEQLCAIMFNTMGMLHEILKNKVDTQEPL